MLGLLVVARALVRQKWKECEVHSSRCCRWLDQGGRSCCCITCSTSDCRCLLVAPNWLFMSSICCWFMVWISSIFWSVEASRLTKWQHRRPTHAGHLALELACQATKSPLVMRARCSVRTIPGTSELRANNPDRATQPGSSDQDRLF
jgi:hypothetical protein